MALVPRYTTLSISCMSSASTRLNFFVSLQAQPIARSSCGEGHFCVTPLHYSRWYLCMNYTLSFSLRLTPRKLQVRCLSLLLFLMRACCLQFAQHVGYNVSIIVPTISHLDFLWTHSVFYKGRDVLRYVLSGTAGLLDWT